MTDEAQDQTGADAQPTSHAEANSKPGKLSLKMLAEQQGRLADATDEAITRLDDKMTSSLQELQAQQAQFFEALKGMTAQNHPSGSREFNHPDARDSLPDDEILPENIHIPQRKDVDSPAFADKEELMAFMQEPVTIFILPSESEQSDPIFTVYVNRLCITMERGCTYTVPRYFVETLARGKPLGYTQEPVQEVRGRHGHDLWANRRTTNLRYPFQITHDTPQGRTYLEAVINEP